MQRVSPAAPVEARTSAVTSEAPSAARVTTSERAPGIDRETALRHWPARADVLIVGFWALVASLLGRGLGPALPGSSAGIGRWIVEVEELGAFASQFMLMMGAAVCVRLLLAALSCRSYFFRPIAVLTTAAALPIVISASSRNLAPEWLIALVGLSATLTVTSALPAMRVPQTRVAGLVLGFVTMGSLVSAAGRTIALFASEQAEVSLFATARAVATGGLVLDSLSVVCVALWLGLRWRFRGFGLVLVYVAAAVLIVWAGLRGDAADTLGVVAGRALAALTSHPDPFLGSGFRYFIEVLAMLLAATTLWLARPSGVGAALSFALLARVSGDVPLCALMLMLSAFSAVKASLQSAWPGDASAEPPGHRAQLEVVPATR